MKLVHVRGNTWYLEGKELIPLYMLGGGRCVLLDCGLIGEREELDAALASADLVPEGVLGSHTHVDHWGNAMYLSRRYGARLALTQGEAAVAICPELLRGIYGSLSPELFAQKYSHMVGRVDQILPPDDGPTAFCGVTFQVIHTPGHSADQVCFITPDGVCYLADAAFSTGFLTAAKLPYHGNHSQARASMEKLAKLHCPVYVAAHRGVSTDIRRTVEENLTRLDQVGEWVLTLVEGSMSFDQICRRALDELRLYTSQPYKAAIYGRNVRCFLEELRDQGRLIQTIRDGMAYYSRAQ